MAWPDETRTFEQLTHLLKNGFYQIIHWNSKTQNFYRFNHYEPDFDNPSMYVCRYMTKLTKAPAEHLIKFSGAVKISAEGDEREIYRVPREVRE